MPLVIAQTMPLSFNDVKHYHSIIFYSSIVDGNLWCPDCVAVDNLIQNTFGAPDGVSALIVYVGDRVAWKASTNVFRAQPWNIRSIPTIIRVRDSKEDARLVGSEIVEGLTSFVQVVAV